MLFDDPQLNNQITNASRTLLNNKEFYDYLKKNIHPNNGSFTDLNELKNDAFFSKQEQDLMIDAFSLFKGLSRIENHEGYVEIVLLLESRHNVSLYYFPKDSIFIDKYESYMRYFQQFYNVVHIDDNWCMGI